MRPTLETPPHTKGGDSMHHTAPPPGVAQLRRFQWAVRATLAVGVAASVCANVLHARDNPISQTIAAWPPEQRPAEHPQNSNPTGHGQPSPPLTLLPPPHREPASIASAVDADPDLVTLLPAARTARDELRRQGRSLTRDSLARQLRRD